MREYNVVNNIRVSFPQKLIYSIFSLNFNDVILEKKAGVYSIDVYIKDINLCIEYDGMYWHKDKNTISKDEKKERFIVESFNFNIIRIRENGSYPIDSIGYVYEYDYTKNISTGFNELVEICYDIIKSYKDSIVRINNSDFNTVNEIVGEKYQKYYIKVNDKHKEELYNLLSKEPNFIEVAKLFGISDNALRKRCKKLGIPHQSSYYIKIFEDEKGYSYVTYRNYIEFKNNCEDFDKILELIENETKNKIVTTNKIMSENLYKLIIKIYGLQPPLSLNQYDVVYKDDPRYEDLIRFYEDIGKSRGKSSF